MGKTPPAKKVDTVVIVEHEGPLMLPKGMSLSAAIRTLEQEREHRETVIAINAPIEGFVPDVANAFFQTLKARYGWVHNKPTPGFFGDKPPTMLTVCVGVNEYIEVPWGRTVVPGIDGYLQPGVDEYAGRFRFVLHGETKRKYEDTIAEIVTQTKEYLRHNSVFKGKAFRLSLKDPDGEPKVMPEPTFLAIDPNLRHELVFSEDVEQAITTSVLTPIRHTELGRSVGAPRKRGILLTGRYGTGKSMTSHVVADVATTHGWTFILCERADELGEILRLARDYGPAVVFCEDIDRVMSGKRDMDMDEVLNIIDGVESKTAELMVILTTNHVENINQAMLRPGRLDAVIEVKPPDSAAVERLMRLYGRGLIAEDADVSAAASMLAGQIPAVIQEVVERSKWAAIARNPVPASEWGPGAINVDDLLAATRAMQNQLSLLAERAEDTRSEEVKAAAITAEAMVAAAKVRVYEPHANGTKEPAAV